MRAAIRCGLLLVAMLAVPAEKVSVPPVMLEAFASVRVLPPFVRLPPVMVREAIVSMRAAGSNVPLESVMLEVSAI